MSSLFCSPQDLAARWGFPFGIRLVLNETLEKEFIPGLPLRLETKELTSRFKTFLLAETLSTPLSDYEIGKHFRKAIWLLEAYGWKVLSDSGPEDFFQVSVK